MKIIGVVLYLMNFEGGAPVKIAQLTSMEACVQSMTEAKGNSAHFLPGKLICIPIYEKEEA